MYATLAECIKTNVPAVVPESVVVAWCLAA